MFQLGVHYTYIALVGGVSRLPTVLLAQGVAQTLAGVTGAFDSECKTLHQGVSVVLV